MNVGVVSDGKFGDRAFSNIRERFPTIWITVPYPAEAVLDDVELEIPECDLYISYARHPDIVLAIAGQGRPLLLGVAAGPGLIRQAMRVNPRTVAPVTLCSLLPETGITDVDRFATIFGTPLLEADLHGDQIRGMDVRREAPCGSTRCAARELAGRTVSEETLRAFGLRICHFCAAPRLGRTCDKEYSAFHHVIALIDAVARVDPGLAGRLEPLREEAMKGRDARIRAGGSRDPPVAPVRSPACNREDE